MVQSVNTTLYSLRMRLYTLAKNDLASSGLITRVHKGEYFYKSTSVSNLSLYTLKYTYIVKDIQCLECIIWSLQNVKNIQHNSMT